VLPVGENTTLFGLAVLSFMDTSHELRAPMIVKMPEYLNTGIFPIVLMD
jgi:hypothetical protein